MPRIGSTMKTFKKGEPLVTGAFPPEYNKYTTLQLLKIIAFIRKNMQDLANQLQDSRPDIAHVIDCIVDQPHNPIDPDFKPESKHMTIIGNNVIVFDHKNQMFHRLDVNTNELVKSYKAKNQEEITKELT